MDDILDTLLGFDKKKQIFDLWYEVTFLRMVVSHMVAQSLYLQEVMTPQVIEDCRKHAQEVVQKKFPHCKIDFLSEKQPDTATGENGQESPCCTRPDCSESPDVSPPPLSEV